jgi:superfamily II DNA or RNA helicase
MKNLSLFDFENIPDELTLKPLQILSMNEIREAMQTSKKIVYQAATGLGKTIIAAQIVKNAQEKGKSVLFIADRIVLCNQTSDVFLKYGIKHGVIQSGNPRWNTRLPVQVCSIHTLKTRGCPENADLIIIDECHVLHKKHIEIMESNPQAYILGLTATPYAKEMGRYFDRHIEPVKMKYLIDNNYLVPFEIYGPTIADLSKLKVRAGEFTEESNTKVFDKADIIGDVVKMWQKLTPNKKTIVFGANIAHIKHIVKSFQEVGVSACQINAYDDARDETLKSFTQGDVKVLCSVEVATKGFDCPEAEVCILAVATRSMIKWAQTCGRVLRTYQGKEKAVILDFGGNAERLGFFDEFEFLGLDDGKKKESKKQEPKEKLPKACPSCDFIKPVGVHTCPACGFTPERIKDVEVAQGTLEKLQRKTRKEYSIEEKQNFLAQLNQYAEDHNMRRGKSGMYGFAFYAYKEKFGTQPSGKINWSARVPVGEEVKKYMIHRNIRYAKEKEREDVLTEARV